jgi:protein ImuA
MTAPLSKLPPQVAAALWQGDALGAAVGRRVASGHAALDAHLPGGGWPCGQLTEVLQAPGVHGEWRLLGPALAQLLGAPPGMRKRDAAPRSARAQRGSATRAAGHTLLLIGPPWHPHVPGLRQHGLADRQVVWVDVARQADRLWAIEQALKANVAAAVLAWLPQARPEHLRRLQVCAQRGEAPVFVFRPATARLDPSAAPLRLLIERVAAVGQGMALEGALQVRILKRRGAPHDELITLAARPGPWARVLAHRVHRGTSLPVWAADQPQGTPAVLPASTENPHALLVGPLPAAAPGHAG